MTSYSSTSESASCTKVRDSNAVFVITTRPPFEEMPISFVLVPFHFESIRATEAESSGDDCSCELRDGPVCRVRSTSKPDKRIGDAHLHLFGQHPRRLMNFLPERCRVSELDGQGPGG